VKLNFLIAVVALVPLQAAAQQVPASVAPGQIEKQFEEPFEARAADDQIVVPRAMQEAPPNAADLTISVASITIDGATLYSAAELLNLQANLEGQTVPLTRVYDIANAITAQYRNDGYVLSRAVVVEQRFDKEAADIRIQVVEGYVLAVDFEGPNRGRGSLIRRMADVVSEERPHQQQTLETFLLLLNDMPGKTAKGTYVPVEGSPGAFRVLVSQSRDSMNFLLGQTNRGSEILGPEQSELGITLNSALGGQEVTNIRYISSDFDDELNLLSVGQSYWLGAGGGQLSWNYNDTNAVPDFRTLDEFQSLSNLETESTTATLGLHFPIKRTRRSNIDLRFSLSVHEGITQDELFDDREDRITSLRAGLTFDWVDRARGINIFDLEFSKGIDAFDSSQPGDPGLSRDGGRPDYFKTRIYVARIQSLGGPVSLLLAAEAQHSDDILLSSEQFGVGGPTFVRGYDASEIVGDSGASAKAELRINFGSVAENGSRGMLYAFYDEGGVRREVPAVGEERREWRSSAGGGLRFTLGGILSGYVEAAVPLDEPVALEQSDDTRIFGGVTLQF
jgi:hemolysin activation/secretion protein